MARKSQLGNLSKQEKKRIYNKRYIANKKAGTVRAYTKKHFADGQVWNTNKTLDTIEAKEKTAKDAKVNLERYIKQFAKTNKKQLELIENFNVKYLEAEGYNDIAHFKSSMNAILRSAAMRRQRKKQYDEFTVRATDMILQDIYEELPSSAQEAIKIVMTDPNPRFNGFKWNESGKYFENEWFIVKIKQYNDGSYQEDTMIVEAKGSIEEMYEANKG